MKLAALPTPAALVDGPRMLANIQRMQARISQLGARLRPHVKTAKCIEVARAQMQAGAVGITVSTLKEAEQFFAAGFDDILYAVCIVPHKLAQALALVLRGCKLTVLVDSLAAAQAVVTQGHAAGVALRAMIEIDTDGHHAAGRDRGARRGLRLPRPGHV